MRSASDHGGAANCTPTGSPDGAVCNGSDSAGRPLRLYITVNAAIGVQFTITAFGSSSMPAQHEPATGGSTAMVGVTNTSKCSAPVPPNCSTNRRDPSWRRWTTQAYSYALVLSASWWLAMSCGSMSVGSTRSTYAALVD